MDKVAPFLLVLWVPLVVFFFPMLRGHRGVIVFLLAGLMFLPVLASKEAGGEPISLSPFHFHKENSISYAVLAAVLCYDFKRLMTFRLSWGDLPMLLWCCSPIASALANEPPPDGSPALRDGLSQALQVFTEWGIPYLLGRLYLTDRKAWRDLALCMAVAALVYAPLCLIEVRLSPQLHKWVYGYRQSMFAMTLRYDGFRPMVFFDQGLTLSLWMVTALLMTAWLWCTDDPNEADNSRPAILDYLLWFLFLLVPTVVLLKSTGALGLGALAGGVLLVTRWWPSRLGLLALVAIPVLYLTLRTTGLWRGEEVVAFIAQNFSAERAESLAFRLDNEELLRDRALQQPWLGWGGWKRGRVFDAAGNDLTITDGRWIIALGDRGLLGLAALFGSMLVPCLRFIFLFPARRWSDPDVGPVAAATVGILLFSIDSLLNGGLDHIFPFMAGGLIALAPRLFVGPQAAPARKAARVRPRPEAAVFSGGLKRA